MDNIANHIAQVRANIAAAALRSGRRAEEITLIAVTKTRTPQAAAAAVRAGVFDLGENRVQEFTEKYGELQHLVDADKEKPNIKWHLIGHLQRNKVKYIADKVSLIHSADSYKLAGEIDTRAKAANRRIDVLIQLNPAGEAQKSGVPPSEAEPLIRAAVNDFPHVRVCGLMAVMPAADDPEEVRMYFREVRGLYERLRSQYAAAGGADTAFRHLSMGMTHDYEVAIEEGATMVRVGTGIFGPAESQ
ncbi:MAG: YggS family pyridoxal phosphate-dependent enzyme [Clostridiales Family XIII bacterium]|jgi:pyridoxal phosphate enzyme (YggS family)|nr:YggS family pyridoxal phosphate-dependent enzyme [Clostridiales Family XIII bacterium]